MSDEVENQGENTEAVDSGTTAVEAVESEFEPPTEPEKSPDLKAIAVSAAEDAVGVGEQALLEAEEALQVLEANDPQLNAATADGGGLREKLLFLTLFINMALLVAFLVIPGMKSKSGSGQGVGNHDASEHGKSVGTQERIEELTPKVGTRGEAFRDDQLYEKALFLSRRGDYPGAASSLKRLLRVNPDLSDAYLRLIYGALAHNLIRDGRKAEAEEYLDRIDRLTKLQSLPEDLVMAATRAAADGRGMDMRRYYARFLLQQDQVRPDMRDTITEAYLRIADSYRLDAEEGAKATVESDRVTRPEKPGKASAKTDKGGHK